MQIAMSEEDFIRRVLQIARADGYPVARNRDGFLQIDFGHKKLHEQHLRKMYPNVLSGYQSISQLIDNVAPGRPCAHKPMREIIMKLRAELAAAQQQARRQN